MVSVYCRLYFVRCKTVLLVSHHMVRQLALRVATVRR